MCAIKGTRLGPILEQVFVRIGGIWTLKIRKNGLKKHCLELDMKVSDLRSSWLDD